MRDILWLGAGFGVVWIGLGAYLVRLWLAQRNLNDRLQRLEQRRPREPG